MTDRDELHSSLGFQISAYLMYVNEYVFQGAALMQMVKTGHTKCYISPTAVR